MSRTQFVAAGLVMVLTSSAVAHAPVDYVKDIKPLLTAKCVTCHGGLRQKGNLRLDAAKFLLKGGDSGPAIVAGDAAKSAVIEAVTGANGRTKMPVEGEPLNDEQIELLQRWIDAGAKAPDDEPVTDPRAHWAFKKPARPRIPLPLGEGTGQMRNPIDTFIAAECDERGLTPLPAPDKATLLRRVTIDLIGLPPTRDELLAFLNDDSADAYEQVVDRLLDSPLHAQRWARHWMDVWRYSDWYGSRGGNELRNSRRHIWRWRDWIVESLAADKGYDRMIVEMLAADEIAPGDRDIARAGGFLGRNFYVFNRNTWLQETVEYTGAAFLGLTFKCARCHDHKFDPIAQEEYYRLRAFFEPHHVRTDPFVGKSELITGNVAANSPPGAKLKDGADVVYDADLQAATYLFERGNEKNPIKDTPLSPGVPEVIGSTDLHIEPVALPIEAYYPDLRAERRQELIDSARNAVSQSEAVARKSQEAVAAARQRLEQIEARLAAGSPGGEGAPTLEDNFTQARPDVWKVHSGDWQYTDGKLTLKKPGQFTTIATLANHPQDFQLTLKYRTLSEGSIGSVGVFFDLVELKDAQAVYTHINSGSSGVQAFHRKNGAEEYPAVGIVKCPLKVNEDTNLELTARGQQLMIRLNGELRLTYTMPVPRQPGRIGLWCHAGTAEFLSLRIAPVEPTVEEARLALQTAESEAVLAVKAVDVARAEAVSVEARVAAEVEKHVVRTPTSERPDVGVRSTDASRAERAAALAKAELEELRAEQQLETAKAAAKPNDAKAQDAVKAAEAKLTTTHTAVENAKVDAAKEDSTYSPLGPTYPASSTGRRLALARWITSQDNPLTARVAVNHVWKRHFGIGLVPSVANFGMNGKKPTHPALFDWLSVEFMEHGWSFKHLHRLIVTSATYRRASALPNLQASGGRQPPGFSESDHAPTGGLTPPARQKDVDPENRYLWRANIRRMEAEVVRDSLWALNGRLDSSFSGPDLEPAIADSSPRRSLYFRITPDDQSVMLELFDGPTPAECFERSESIVPQQALILANSPLALTQSRLLARKLAETVSGSLVDSNVDFIRLAYESVLGHPPTSDESAKCVEFLARQSKLLADPTKLTRTPTGLPTSVPPSPDPAMRARENLVHVLLNSNDFITVR